MLTPVPEALIDRLVALRRSHVLPLQVRALAEAFAAEVLALLFPHFAPVVVASADAVREDIVRLDESLRRLQRAIETLRMPARGAMRRQGPVRDSDGAAASDVREGHVPADCRGLSAAFLAGLGVVHEALLEDADAIYRGDPAASSLDEVLLTYPGFYAIAVYRVAHALYDLGMPLLPRLLAEHAHQRTGVDIHPGARIGARFCIDHGTGVVIGETCVIGDRVKIYQGVTLGALTVEKQLAGTKRHPTIEDDVVLYAAATILGGDTVVGQSSIIGGNAWLTESVPPFSLVSRRAEVKPRQGGEAVLLDFNI